MMSTHVINEFHAKPSRGDDILALLLELAPESRGRPGCEEISIRRNQDDPNNVIGDTRWTDARPTGERRRGACGLLLAPRREVTEDGSGPPSLLSSRQSKSATAEVPAARAAASSRLPACPGQASDGVKVETRLLLPVVAKSCLGTVASRPVRPVEVLTAMKALARAREVVRECRRSYCRDLFPRSPTRGR
jgi:Antibiotic biosynthesis monooxygenase